MRELGRRDFLKACGTSASVLFLSSALTPRPILAHSLFSLPLTRNDKGEIDWSLVRQQFSLREGLIMLNAANLAPMPTKLAQKQWELTMSIDADPSFTNRDRFLGYYEAGVAALAQFIGADFDEVAITRNTSESNNIVINGLDLTSNDEVVIWEQNHPSNNLAWEMQQAHKGFSIKKVTTPKFPADKHDLINPFLEALSEKTRVLAFSHVGNDTGVRLPIKELITIAKQREILTLVDGAQSLGVLNIDVKDLGLDCYTASLHKWPCGPKETGLLYIKKDLQKQIQPSIITVDFEEGPYVCAARFSAFSQRDDAALAVIKDMVDFHMWLGKSSIENYLLFLAEHLKKNLIKTIPDIQFITPISADLSASIVCFKAPGIDYKTAFNYFYDHYNIALDSWDYDIDPFYSCIRICPHIYNSTSELDFVIQAIAETKMS